jgi:hypothetical protein
LIAQKSNKTGSFVGTSSSLHNTNKLRKKNQQVAQAGLAAKDPVAFVAGEQRKLLVAEGKPFVFVNVVLSDSQAFLPVLDMVRAL